MKRNRWAILALLVAGLSCSAISLFGQVTNAAKLGDVSNSSIYGVNVGPGERAKVGSNVSGGTQFNLSSLIGRGDDFYNTGFKYRVLKAANATSGTIGDITDYVSSSGTFTVTTPGANWASGDWVEIISDEVAAQTFGYGVGGGVVATAQVTTASGANSVVDPTDADTITVANFAGLNTVLFSGLGSGVTASRYYLRFEQADESADAELIGQYRSIVSVSSAGVVIYTSGFDVGGSTDVIDAGDIVSIVPFSEINPNPQVLYRGTSSSGSATTAIFPDLIGIPNAILKDSYIKCIEDEAGSDEGDMALVSGFTVGTGTVTFTTGIITPTVNDQWEIVYTPAAEMAGGANGWPAAVTGTFPAVSVSTNEAIQWQSDSLRRAFAQITDIDSSVNNVRAATASILGVNDWDTLVVYVNHVLVDSVWVTVGENEVITMPDGALIECRLSVRDSIVIGGADSIAVCAGDGTSTLLTKVLKSDWIAGEYISYAPGSIGTYRTENPAIVNWAIIGDGMAGTKELHFYSNGADIGYNVQTATIITTGYSIWTLIYRKVSGTGAPAAGTGGDL